MRGSTPENQLYLWLTPITPPFHFVRRSKIDADAPSPPPMEDPPRPDPGSNQVPKNQNCSEVFRHFFCFYSHIYAFLCPRQKEMEFITKLTPQGMPARPGEPATGKATPRACRALQELLTTEQDCRAALDANAVPILTTTLLHHGTSPSVMMDGMQALLQLAASDHGWPGSGCPAHPQLTWMEWHKPAGSHVFPSKTQLNTMR